MGSGVILAAVLTEICLKCMADIFQRTSSVVDRNSKDSIDGVTKSTFSQPFKEQCISEEVRISSILISHLATKAKFSILCDVIFLVRLQGKFDIERSWE